MLSPVSAVGRKSALEKEKEMDRREFSKSGLLLGTGMLAGCQESNAQKKVAQEEGYYIEPPKNLPYRDLGDTLIKDGAYLES